MNTCISGQIGVFVWKADMCVLQYTMGPNLLVNQWVASWGYNGCKKGAWPTESVGKWRERDPHLASHLQSLTVLRHNIETTKPK